MLQLSVMQGPDKGKEFELPDDEPQQIGRSGESLPLTDHTISRRHAELTPDDGKWLINDLESSNGTFVNGVRVTKRRVLEPGDQIRTGATLFLYGDDQSSQRRRQVRMTGKNEIDVNVEQTVASNDDSMIMAVADPSQAAEFQLKVVYEITALIGSLTDQQKLLERVMDVIFAYFKADRGVIMLQNSKDKNKISDPAVVRYKKKKKTLDSGPVEISKTIVRHVRRNNVGVLSSNAMNDTRFSTGDSVQAYGIRSTMCVPIKFQKKFYGVIYLDSKIANYTYTQDQLTLLTVVGAQTGLALANARLYAARLKSQRLATVGQTVASLSHSIKNILQGMRGGADVVEMGLGKKNLELANNGWEIVSRNLERIYSLSMNMLAFSKQRKPEFELVNIPSFLEELQTLMQKQFDTKKVALITDFQSDMPPVPIDPAGVHQAVLNLLNNALDAVEPEKGAVTLRSEFAKDGKSFSIKVIDNGVGMSKETQSRLFEPFHSTKGLRGTGLGLVVTKKIAQEHSGTIKAQSQVEDEQDEDGSLSKQDSGTTFTLKLPAQQNLSLADDTGHS